jgi:hypothetical protein
MSALGSGAEVYGYVNVAGNADSFNYSLGSDECKGARGDSPRRPAALSRRYAL